MSPRLDLAARFAEAGIPLEADADALQAELEQRGWQVQVEAPLRDDARRRGRRHGNRYRALAFRAQRGDRASGRRPSDHASQTGASAAEALRKVLATILNRADA